MKRIFFGSSWQIAGLAAVLTVILLTVPCDAAQQGPGRANRLSLSIVRVGRLVVGQEVRDEAHGTSSKDSFMRQREPLVFQLSAPVPPRGRLYLLVRREGENAWRAQRVASGQGGRNTSGEWTAEVELGRPEDVGIRFQIQVVAAGESLPALLSDDMRAKAILSGSSVVEVERRPVKPSVAITGILAFAPAGTAFPPDTQYVYGDEELIVHEESWVELTARDLPAGSRVGVTVLPDNSNEYWVMDDFLGDGQGSIRTHFGLGDSNDKSFSYLVSAFVAPGDALPPAGRGISPAEWDKYRRQFLSESRGVHVVRWQRELKIEEIGGLPVQPGRTLIIDRQVDVRGAAKRRLEHGERIWLVCLPLQGDPWVVQSELELTPSGHWVMTAVQLRKGLKPEPFDVIAVVSAEDVSKIRPETLRWWLASVESGDTSIRVSVSVLRTGTP